MGGRGGRKGVQRVGRSKAKACRPGIKLWQAPKRGLALFPVQEIIMAVYDEGFKAGIKYAERTSNEQPRREIFQSSLHT